MAEARQSLERVRESIDGLDDRIHDLIMERAALVAEVVRAKGGGSAYRPGREAQILRRLAARRAGPFPALAALRIWREIVSASLGLQGGFAVAVHIGEGGGCEGLARDHFGAATDISMHGSVASVVNAAADGRGVLGILPFPRDGDPDPWWPRLAADGAPAIVARLPFAPFPARPGQEGGAAVIAGAAADPSGDDRSLIALGNEAGASMARIGEACRRRGLRPTMMLSHEDNAAGAGIVLVEVDGYLAPEDDRMVSLGRESPEAGRGGARLLGAYAAPLGRAGAAGP